MTWRVSRCLQRVTVWAVVLDEHLPGAPDHQFRLD